MAKNAPIGTTSPKAGTGITLAAWVTHGGSVRRHRQAPP